MVFLLLTAMLKWAAYRTFVVAPIEDFAADLRQSASVVALFAVALGFPMLAAFPLTIDFLMDHGLRGFACLGLVAYPISFVRWVLLLRWAVRRLDMSHSEIEASGRPNADFEWSYRRFALTGVGWDLLTDLLVAFLAPLALIML